MKEDRKSYYKSKITSSNMTGIICTMFEMFDEYLKDAKVGNSVDLNEVRNANRVLEHLKDALNFDYEISANLFALYDFCQRLLSKAMYTNDPTHLETAGRIMKELHESFIEVEKQDKSGAAMNNSQHVTAGMTYGRNDVTEVIDNNRNRGFLA